MHIGLNGRTCSAVVTLVAGLTAAVGLRVANA